MKIIDKGKFYDSDRAELIATFKTWEQDDNYFNIYESLYLSDKWQYFVFEYTKDLVDGIEDILYFYLLDIKKCLDWLEKWQYKFDKKDRKKMHEHFWDYLIDW